MSVDPIISLVAHEFENFTLGGGEPTEEPDPFDHYCSYARIFKRWVDETLDKYVRHGVDEVRLAQAKMLLLDRYFEFRSYAPKGHRDKLGDKGHVCIYGVLVEAYHEIRMAQLSLNPPEVLIVPSKAEQTNPLTSFAQIPALLLGELKG